MFALDLQYRNAPCVPGLVVEPDAIAGIGQHFAEAANAEMPWAGPSDAVFQFRADAFVPETREAERTALVTVAAQEPIVFVRHVAKPWNIATSRSSARVVLVVVTGIGSSRTNSTEMIHQVLAEHAARVGDSIRKILRS